MSDRLRLNLSALRALETAERCRSFTAAAHELSLTHSAISHQIRQIESMLDIVLFTRTQSRMIPTSTCTRLAERVRESLTEIECALLEAGKANRQQRLVLKVSVMADFATVWLIPELEAFYSQYPHLDLSIAVRNTLDIPEGYESDIGIWHKSVDRNGFQSRKLLEDQVIAVCTPAFLEKHGPLTVADLVHVPLMRFTGRSWQEFFHAANLAAGDPEHGPIFDDAASLLHAALAGQGVAMLRERLTGSYLQQGKLVQVGSTRIPSNLAYYLCWREGHPKQEAILQFVGWLEGMVRQADTTTTRYPRGRAS
ncbi:LysR substrate-binding domain-containing protein [Paraburkholderia sp. BL21I4N1]|uniref:LysR substrate-binding domain-containing protein n=1 Tax=Paraburkholderia sp. BL21I4N1 TaxID=1938801 RepID=UPI000CFD26B7|nr:LysR substrate-binding domain-containing protein [Paraburkholderia sp. BL21I4N1]PQV54801.1 LysR family transcriptional regulator [Paraburkholderia sp. BL21I4N1]